MRKTGEVLRDYRLKNKLTIEKFAEILDVSQTFVRFLENDTKRVSERMLGILEKILSEKEIVEIIEYEKFMNIPDFLKTAEKKYRKKDIEIETLNISFLNEEQKKKIKEFLSFLEYSQQEGYNKI
ncbi:MAG: helix-turn-helix domain-containing protein [Fusobacterium sp.]|uniref:helix-turn-helix domain-containing protein n=1 Tax=Fusobacterium sp. TaxID=68766 RepID=UPI0026DAE54A|nr:helix-turn-helix domain-containing protein [Fusobacterium sp.]MDO4690423.1 helix-turn-helix domain-containing protein [Fusobacterium sp.]